MTEFTWPIRVYYEDTDAGGVVYHANYLKFLERARTEMLRAVGFEHDTLLVNENVLFVLRSLSIDYIIPSKFNDLLTVHSKITALKRASFMFEQSIHRAETVLCKATVSVVCVDADTFSPKAMPRNLHNAFAKID